VDAKWLEDIRRKVRRDYYVEDLAVSAASAKVRKLIDQHVKAEEVVQLLEPVPILSERFSEEVERLASPKAKTERMLHALWAQVNENLPTDPALYESVKGRLERIIAERKLARINEVEAFRQLLIEYEKLKSAQERPSEWEKHSPHARAFFHLLEAKMEGASVAGPEREARKKLTESIIAVLESESVIDWVQKEDIQRTMRRNVKRQLRTARWPDEKIDETVVAIMDLARARLGKR
jgi:type I restriction enzyme R subunit